MAPLPTQPHESQDATLAVSGLVIALAVVSVALRFYTRIFTKSGLRADDWLLLAAVVATLATAALVLYGNSVDPNGLYVSENTDRSYVYTPQDILYLKLAFSMSVIYFLIAATTKLGILLMYNRIFNVSNFFRYQLWVSSALVIGWWIGCTTASLTNCIPLKWSWINSWADARYCFDYNVFWMASGACEIFLDVLILTLPISVVVRMHLSLKRKLIILGIFLLGGFIVVTGLVRVVLGFKKNSRVPSYSNTEVWTTVHAGMSIVCASLPIFKPLIRRIATSAVVVKVSSILSIQRRSKSASSSQKSSLPSVVVITSLPSISTNVGGRVEASGGNLEGSDPISGAPALQVIERTESLSAQWEGYLDKSESSKKSPQVAHEEV